MTRSRIMTCRYAGSAGALRTPPTSCSAPPPLLTRRTAPALTVDGRARSVEWILGHSTIFAERCISDDSDLPQQFEVLGGRPVWKGPLKHRRSDDARSDDRSGAWGRSHRERRERRQGPFRRDDASRSAVAKGLAGSVRGESSWAGLRV